MKEEYLRPAFASLEIMLRYMFQEKERTLLIGQEENKFQVEKIMMQHKE